MPKTLTKSRLHFNKRKLKSEPELFNTKSNLAPNVQTFKQKILSGSGCLGYK